MNDTNSFIIDLDTRVFNFDKLGILYADNVKGAMCIDTFYEK